MAQKVCPIADISQSTQCEVVIFMGKIERKTTNGFLVGTFTEYLKIYRHTSLWRFLLSNGFYNLKEQPFKQN